MNIAALDLNLLLVLHTVLVERSAAAAARRLHVTPSAVSNSLAKLRAQLGDPLVVRSGRGLVPTPRALELAPHLRAAVRELERVVAGSERFDPATTTRSFALALSDAHQICDLPRVARAFATAMPRAQLRVVSIDHFEAVGGLAGGEVDAAVAPATAPQAGQHAYHLYEEAGVLLVRRGHPAAGKPVTRELWASLRHVDIHLALGRGGIGHRAARAWLAGERLAFERRGGGAELPRRRGGRRQLRLRVRPAAPGRRGAGARPAAHAAGDAGPADGVLDRPGMARAHPPRRGGAGVPRAGDRGAGEPAPGEQARPSSARLSLAAARPSFRWNDDTFSPPCAAGRLATPLP
ncbi:LysR family transcriptional regulator [Nannocystis pusilla]|uniref:LysR family transcriptional regulator n=1 Tax=Nannocystis pusilla TaxID=889268 RepID=UPI003DA3898E